MSSRARFPPGVHVELVNRSVDLDRVILRAELRSALVGISDHHRTAVVKTILLDRRYAEVAAEFGIKAGTLRTGVRYALRQLRSTLGAAELAC